MIAEPIAVQMAARSTHRRIHQPKREPDSTRRWRRRVNTGGA